MLRSDWASEVKTSKRIYLKKGCQKSSSSIDLSGQNLTEIPEAVFQSSQLSSLNLRHNLFQNVNSPASPLSDLLKLKHLRIVNLSSNGLEEFPCVLCHLETLVEVNLSCNKITHVPDDVSQLTKLEQLELHSNQISILPDSLENCVALKKLNLGFNSFSRVPDVLSKMKLLDQIALPGNTLNNLECYECSHPENKVITKADFCRNSISGDVFLGQCSAYKHLTELDISDNNIRCLDVSELIHLKSLKCVNNQIHDLRVNGQSLKLLIAAKNELDSITIHPVPETLQSLDLSRNHISSVPSWICDLVYLKHLDLSYNDLQELYPNILLNPSICILYVNNNRLKLIGEINQQSSLEMLFAQNNMIVELPVDFFQKAKDLRVLNMTNNRLTSLPAPNLKETHVQEMYLSANYLSDAALSGMSRMVRLRCLHLAHNDIHILPESLIINLVELEELNVSGNRLTRIPNALTTLSNLVICKLHSNNIRQLPNFLPLTKLKDLDVSCNGLKNINLSTLLPPTLQALDISNNPQLPVNPKDVRKSSGRNVKLVDTTCGRRSMSRSLDDLLSCDDHLWTLGFSETSGQRNKLCVSQLRLPHYSSDPDGSNASQECLLGMFDGGLNNELPHIMTEILPQIVLKERTCTETSSDYLRYAILTIHRELENLGRKLGASALVCHISKRQKEDLIPSCNTPGHTHMGVPEYVLRVANVGNMQAVVCQKGVAKVLTRNFSVDKDSAENQRLRDLHTIVTGNGLVCGISSTTRLIGSTYLYPTLIPNPHVTETILHDDDEFLVVANHRLWEVMSPEEVVKEVQLTCNPTAAAKRLQDLAQGYGVQENLSIIVLRLHLVSDPKGQIAAWVHRHSRDAKPWASKFANDISQTLTFQEFKNDPHQILKSINLRGESLSSLTSESNYPKSENNEQDFRTYEEEIRRSKILSKKVVDLGENYTHHLHDCYPTMGSEKTWSDDNNHDSAIDIDPLSSSEGHAHAHDSGSSDSGQNGHLADSEDTGSDISPLGKISDEQLRSWEYFLEENSKMLFEKELISLPAEKKRHFQLALSNKGLLPKGLLKTKLRNSMNELPLSPSSEMGTTEVKSYAPAEAMIHTLAHRYPEIQEQRSHIVEEMIPKKPRNTAVTHL